MRLYTSIVFLFICLTLSAQVPQKISYQGVLTDNNNSPLSGVYNMVFELYNASSGGTALWTETQTDTVIDGVFNVYLGAITPISDTISFNKPYWLQVTVEGTTLPRFELSSSAYSFNTARIQGKQISDTSPTAGQVLKWNGSEWIPEQDNSGGPPSGNAGGDLNGTFPNPTVDGIQNIPVSTTNLSNGKILKYNGSQWVPADDNSGGPPSGNAGGDLDGTFPNPTVVGIRGRTISAETPSTDEVLKWTGNHWEPAQDEIGGLSLPYSGMTSTSSRAFEIVNTGSGMGIYGSGNLFGVYGYGGGSGTGVFGDAGEYGVYGQSGSSSGIGVYGLASSNSASSFGVYGRHQSGKYGRLGGQAFGVFAYATSGYALWAIGNQAQYAGYFTGNVYVSGTVSKSGGNFMIDHPLDPANKILRHSFVESPDMMNVYNGNVTTNASGYANVQLPDYFEALNKDFRYQLTVVGQFSQAIVYKEIQNNIFTIQTDKPNVKVSWQVTGIRKDPWAEKNRIVVEELKSAETRGYYLNPEAYNQPNNRSIEWALHPELMKQVEEESREE